MRKIVALTLFLGTTLFMFASSASSHAEQVNGVNRITEGNDDVMYTYGKESKSIGHVSKEFQYTFFALNTAIANNKPTSDLEAKMSRINSNLPIKNVHFVANRADERKEVNAYHLNKKDTYTINKFAVRLINDFRKQIHTRRYYKVSPQSIKFAKDIANAYSNDNFYTLKESMGHDIPAINRVAQKYGYNIQNNVTQDLEANSCASAVTGAVLSHISMAELKAFIFNAIYELLLKDDVYTPQTEQWGHTIDLGGGYDVIQDNNYIGFGISFDKFGVIHFVHVSNYQAHGKVLKKLKMNSWN